MLAASPSEIIRQFLIEEGLGFDYSLKVDWAVFSGSEPDEPDNSITIISTRGTLDGRIHETGETVEHYGFQTRIRGKTDSLASAKGRQIIVAYNSVLRRLITVNNQDLKIQAITLKSPLLASGQEVKRRRQVYVFNSIVTIDEV